jgi:hypothetical protein
MKKYSVSIPWHCCVYVEVEAEDEKEAIEKALKDVYPNLCHQCANEVEMCEQNDDCEIDVEEL